MNKLFRFAVVAALTVAMLAAVPTAQAQLQEPIGDCDYVFVSYDGGQTWYQCDNYGRVETRDTISCYYSCPGMA
jgi:hypothetical protein